MDTELILPVPHALGALTLLSSQGAAISNLSSFFSFPRADFDNSSPYGPIPCKPAVGSLKTPLIAAERQRLGCSLSFLSSVPQGMGADERGLDSWKPSRWFQCLSLSCCWDGESTMVLGSRSQHSDFTCFGESASPTAESTNHSHHFYLAVGPPAPAINIPITTCVR